ncbi:putative extracellular nuclease [Neomicrococcus aestuarii]|uniref:Putative extracellular nuclease n=1 Tax=Neomicrococcus aestuarii TaxID=556325 RepID=A0A7W8X010_9MICC|nr:ExeM/NucH family extracellular endonuclease [Neomicrococcus aestuarii]MBB5512388.1 putative extracellular nuclease [Neomicrococcus aestuarii]
MRSSLLKAGTALAAAATLALGFTAPAGALAPAVTVSANVSGTDLIINEAYLSGGSAGAAFKNKFIELYNPTSQAITLDGNYSIAYRSATGTSNPGNFQLTGTVPAKGYFVIKGGTNGTNGADLPNVGATTGINPSGTNGTLVLTRSASAISLPTGSITNNAQVVDLLGYGTSNTFETVAAQSPSSTTDVKSVNRTNFVDTDHNANDFVLSPTITPGTANAGTTGGETPGGDTEAPLKTIAEIQGTGTTTPLPASDVRTRGIVTAVYPTGGFNGYYLQTPGTGGDSLPAASEGIFVYSSATVDEVQIGDYVEVTGEPAEYFNLTQLKVSAGGVKQLTEPAEAIKPLTIAWPTTDAERERVEGMVFDPQGEYTVADNYSLNQYAEIGLAFGTSDLVDGATTLVQPTDVEAPGSAAAADLAVENYQRSVTLDDGATTNFLSNANKSIALPYLTEEAPIRVGAPVQFATDVILDYRNSTWKFQPLTQLTASNAASVQPATFTNTRTAAPDEVGGNVKIASFNVLNYFTTTGDQLTGCTYYRDRAGNPITVSGGCLARGAANAENLQRQQDKIVAAINGLDADVVSLEEIENSAAFGKDRDEALATLVAALNADRPGTWDYVRSPEALPASEDVIRTAFIFKPSVVKTVDESVILDDPAFSNARQPLAQAFQKVGGNSKTRFLAVVNHFKSKGSAPSTGENADNGQGGWSAARVAQAEALVKFADSLKLERNTDKVFLTGDFNSYTQEDAMQVLYEAGYINQNAKTGDYTYLFDGLVGSLDHILASPAANQLVTGVDIWNINADEPIALEYSRYNYNATNFYAPTPYRASDHDPVIVGFEVTKNSPKPVRP